MLQTKISHCEKKLVRLLFDIGVVNTTDDDREQQVPTVALFLQQLIYDSWQHRRQDDGRAGFTTTMVWRQVEQEAVLIFAHIFIWNPNISTEFLERILNAPTESAVPTS